MFKVMLVILLSGSTFTRTDGATSDEIKAAYEKFKIIPERIDVAPTELLGVEYRSKDGVVANLGNFLQQDLVLIGKIPRITWKNSKGGKFYLFIMTDEDLPNRTDDNPDGRTQYHHWVVGNIPGGSGFKPAEGNLINFYRSPMPPEGISHRYNFLIFEQPSKLTFEEPYQCSQYDESFDITNQKLITTREYIQKYKLGTPLAGNFFQVLGVPFQIGTTTPPSYLPTFIPTQPAQPNSKSNCPPSIDLPVGSLLSLDYIPLVLCYIFCHSLRV